MEILKRPVLFFSVLGVIFITIFVLLTPFYFATRPSYCKTCHVMQGYYDTWRQSTHAKQDCVDCHIKPGMNHTIAFAVRMFMPSYYLKNTKPKDLEKPVNGACLRCHSEDRVISPSGIVKIPHKTHIKDQNMRCIDCHKYLVHYKNPSGENKPPMDNCMKRCHNGTKASGACLTCHPKKARPDTHNVSDWDDIHPAKFKQRPLVCTKCHTNCNRCHKIKPASHDMKWKYSAHGKEAETLTSKVCGTCHRQDKCETCHLKHPLNWKDIHYKKVLRDTNRSCRDCHDTQEFCTSCHANIKK